MLGMISVSLSVAVLTSEKQILKRAVQQVRFNSWCVCTSTGSVQSGKYKPDTKQDRSVWQSMTRTCQTATLKTENKEFCLSSCGKSEISDRLCLFCPAVQCSALLRSSVWGCHGSASSHPGSTGTSRSSTAQQPGPAPPHAELCQRERKGTGHMEQACAIAVLWHHCPGTVPATSLTNLNRKYKAATFSPFNTMVLTTLQQLLFVQNLKVWKMLFSAEANLIHLFILSSLASSLASPTWAKCWALTGAALGTAGTAPPLQCHHELRVQLCAESYTDCLLMFRGAKAEFWTEHKTSRSHLYQFHRRHLDVDLDIYYYFVYPRDSCLLKYQSSLSLQ